MGSLSGGLCPGGSLLGRPPLRRVMSGRYASYWNAFLYNNNFVTGQCAGGHRFEMTANTASHGAVLHSGHETIEQCLEGHLLLTIITPILSLLAIIGKQL